MPKKNRAIELLILAASAPGLVALAACSAGLSAGIAILKRMSR